MSRPTSLYRLLLRLYPRGFRRLYGDEMAEAFAALHRRVVARDGAGGAARLWARTVADALRSGLGERIRGRAYRAPGGDGVRIPRSGPAALAEELVRDVRYAFRTLSAAPGYAAAVILTLALGIGANTAVFSVVDGVLLEPLPFGSGGEVVHLRHVRQNGGAPESGSVVGFSVEEIRDYRGGIPGLEDVAEYHRMVFTLTGAGVPARVRVGVVSHNFFDLLEVRPAVGRVFVRADDRRGADAVVLLSHDFWRERFGADPEVVGRRLSLDGRPHQVVGVLPPYPQFPQENELYMPVSVCPTRSDPGFQADREGRLMNAFARLRVGRALDEVRADADEVGRVLAERHPGVYGAPGSYSVEVETVREELVGGARPALLLVLGATGFVLLIACANAANLALARSTRRRRETSVRMLLGAGKGRVSRQLLTEHLVLALAGGVAGLLLARVGLDLLMAYAERFTPRAREVEMDGTVLLFTLGVSLLAGLLFGVGPALMARREDGPLREAGAAGPGRGARRVHALLVVGQVAVTFVLLTGAALTLDGLRRLQALDPGVDTEEVVAFALTGWEEEPGVDGEDRRSRAAFFSRVEARVLEETGASAVSRVRTVPLENAHTHPLPLFLPGDEPGEEPLSSADVRVVDHRYPDVVGARLEEGRPLEPSDTLGAELIAVVNRTLADRLDRLPRGSDGGAGSAGSAGIVNRRVVVCHDGGCDPPVRIVGVVADIRSRGGTAEVAPELYYHGPQTTFGGDRFVLRVPGGAAGAMERIPAAVHALAPSVAVSDVTTLELLRQASLAPTRLTVRLLLLFAAVALGVTLTGLFGVLSLAAGSRVRELGVRQALGAPPASIAALVLREALVLVSAGLLLGAAGSVPLTRLVQGTVQGVETLGPAPLTAAAALFLATALVASWLPARRAARVDPCETLRAG